MSVETSTHLSVQQLSKPAITQLLTSSVIKFDSRATDLDVVLDILLSMNLGMTPASLLCFY